MTASTFLQKLTTKFETPGTLVTLEDINNLARKADPLRAIMLLAAKQNSVAKPHDAEQSADAICKIGTRAFVKIDKVLLADTAFLALLQSENPKTAKYAADLIKKANVSDPVGKIEASSCAFKTELLGLITMQQKWSDGRYHLSEHGAPAVQALCRIGGEKAENYVAVAVREHPELQDVAHQAFPELAAKCLLQNILNERDQKHISETVVALRDLNDGQFVDHLARVGYRSSTADSKYIILELAEQQTEEAANIIYHLARPNDEVHLSALDALGSMRRYALDHGKNDVEAYNVYIETLLKNAIDIEVLKQISEPNRSKYAYHFRAAAEQGIIPTYHADVFSKTVNWITQGEALEEAIEVIRASEPVNSPRAFQ